MMFPVVESCNRFALDLYSRMAGARGNRIFSPSSISMALAMTYAGAGGETARELAEVLHFSLPPEQVHDGFRQLRERGRTGGVELRIANRLWGQRGYAFLPRFLETVERGYGAGLGEVDFRAEAEQARAQINAWVEEQTARRIVDLVPPGSLDALTRLVLTNAIYFLGSWESEFNEKRTQAAPFFDRAGDSVAVPLMCQSGHFRYGESADLQMLELPYKSEALQVRLVQRDGMVCLEAVEAPSGGSDFAMCIVLPRRPTGLVDIEARLTPAFFQSLHHEECLVDVWLPKFKLDYNVLLNDVLQSLGMKQAFSVDQADFSAMADDPEGLLVSAVLHKATVDVNEKGTEAAAATALVMRGGCVREQTERKIFRADHPFLFLIRDRSSQLIHFMGRVEELGR